MALILIVSAQPFALAESWGAGLPPGGDTHRCTVYPDRDSECTANNDLHYVFITPSLNTNMTTALENSITDDYAAIPEITAFTTSSTGNADVQVYEQNIGPGIRGYTTCQIGASFGETGKNEWCRPQFIYLNNYYEDSEWNVSGAKRKWLACHELGHTLGLQHPEAFHAQHYDDSCMRPDLVPGPADLWGFDIEHLEDCYPHHPFDEAPICRD